MRHENVQLLNLLEHLDLTVKSLQTTSMLPWAQSQHIQNNHPTYVNPTMGAFRPTQSFKLKNAKSYFSLSENKHQQQQLEQKLNNCNNSPQNGKSNETQNVNISNKDVTMPAAKIINLKRNSFNLAIHVQFSIDAIKTKTKDFITGKHLTKSFSMHETYHNHSQNNTSAHNNKSQQDHQYLNGKHIQLVKIRLRQTCEQNSSHSTNISDQRLENANVKTLTSKNSNISNQFLNNEIFYI